MSSDVRGRRSGNIVIDRLRAGIYCSPLEYTPPPRRRVERSLAVVQGRIDVAKEIPNYTLFVSTGRHSQWFRSRDQIKCQFQGDDARTMPNDNTTNLILGHAAMQHQTKRHQHPRQVRRREDQQAEEAQTGLGIAAGPDVDQAAAEGRAEERDGKQGRKAQQDGGGVEQQPRESCGGTAGGFLEEARIAL